MALDGFLAALLRRWYLVLVGVACAVFATFLVVGRVGPTYSVEGTVLLFPPTTSVERSDQSATQGNPYLLLGGLNPARDILIRSLTSQSVREQIEEDEPDASYDMYADLSISGPVIVATVEADSAASASRTLAMLLQRVPGTLEDLQTGLEIRSNAYITSRALTVDEEPEVIRKSQIRAGIVAGAATMTLTLLLVGLWDGLRSSRRSGRTGRRAQPVSPAPSARPARSENVEATRLPDTAPGRLVTAHKSRRG